MTKLRIVWAFHLLSGFVLATLTLAITPPLREGTGWVIVISVVLLGASLALAGRSSSLLWRRHPILLKSTWSLALASMSFSLASRWLGAPLTPSVAIDAAATLLMLIMRPRFRSSSDREEPEERPESPCR